MITLPTKKEILDLLWNEPYKIGHWVGFTDLTQLHNKWLRSFLFADEDQTLLAHRGSYKTTVLSLFLSIHTVIKPNETVIFFRKTDDDVKEVIRQSQNILMSSCMNRIVTILYGSPIKFDKATDSEINTNLCTSIKGSSQVIGLGIGTSITGKHADIVVTDDIVNLKDRISRAERERTKIQYMELQNIKNRSGRFINTGTPWHKDDAISTMPNIRRYDCYSTGLINRPKLEQLRSNMTDSLFAANYELKHIADKDAMFKEPKFTDEEMLLYDGVCHIDASYGGEDATAFTAMHVLSDGRIIAYGRRWERHVDECLSEIKAAHSRFRLGTIFCEDNADKGYLCKELSNMNLPNRGYHENTNKFVKISTHLKKYWSKIEWLEETDPEYINEILDYSENAAHDDSPDSAASLLRGEENKVRYHPINGGI